MWSDSPDSASVRRWAEELRRFLPAPEATARRRREPVAGRCTPDRAAVRARSREGVVWLDGGSRRGHLLACDPLVELRCSERTATITSPSGSLDLECDGFELLQAAHEAWGGAGQGRLFGYLGYELGSCLEELPKPLPGTAAIPDLWFGLYDCWLEFEGGEWTAVTTDAWRSPPPRLTCLVDADAAAEPAAERPMPAPMVDVDPDDAGFEAAVSRTVDRIRAGEIFQSNLCRHFRAPLPERHAAHLYERMRDQGDADHGALLTLGSGAVLSRSPERFLRCRSRVVESDPIKGTRPRGATPDEDSAQRDSLANSGKDRAELAMIVDLVRNDLGRVCEPGSISVAGFPSLMELPAIWHTWARVRGRLRDDVGSVDLLRACFPPGSITGAPKIQAMVVASVEETRRRGPSMGAIGWIDLNGDLELSVAIRTAVVANGEVVYHAGCGVVADSDPRLELEESLVKARGFLAALDR